MYHFARMIPRVVQQQWCLLAVLVLAFCYLATTYIHGYVADDMFNSTLPGMLQVKDQSPSTAVSLEIIYWITINARVNPLIHIWKGVWWYYVTDVYVHKTLILLLVAGNLILFNSFARTLGASKPVAALACLTVVLSARFQNWFDAIMAFNGMMQLVVGLVLASLLCLQSHLRKERLILYACSVFLFAAACLTYETCYLLFSLPVVLITTSSRPWGRAIREVLPYCLIVGCLVVLRIILQTQPSYLATGQYGATLDNGLVVASTFIKQLVGALPATYVIFDPQQIISWKALFSYFMPALVMGLGFGLLGGTLASLTIRTPFPQAKSSSGRILVLGAILLAFPAIPIAICARYQDELQFGNAHLPVYLQHFGFALIVLAVLGNLSWWIRFGWGFWVVVPGAIAILCAISGGVHQASNLVVVNLHRGNALQRALCEELAESCFSAVLPAKSTLIHDGFPWEIHRHATYFYTTHTKKIVYAFPASELPSYLTDVENNRKAGNAAVYRLRYCDVASAHGIAIIGKVLGLQSSSAGVLDHSVFLAERIAIRRQYYRNGALNGLVSKPGELDHGQDVLRTLFAGRSDTSGYQFVGITRNWLVYEPIQRPMMIADRGSELFYARGPEGLVTTLPYPFDSLESAGSVTFRWCRMPNAEILFSNPGNDPVSVHFQCRVKHPLPVPFTLTLSGLTNRSTEEDSAAIVLLNLTIPPGRHVLRLSSSAPVFNAPGRDIYFGIENLQINSSDTRDLIPGWSTLERKSKGNGSEIVTTAARGPG